MLLLSINVTVPLLSFMSKYSDPFTVLPLYFHEQSTRVWLFFSFAFCFCGLSGSVGQEISLISGYCVATVLFTMAVADCTDMFWQMVKPTMLSAPMTPIAPRTIGAMFSNSKMGSCARFVFFMFVIAFSKKYIPTVIPAMTIIMAMTHLNAMTCCDGMDMSILMIECFFHMEKHI